MSSMHQINLNNLNRSSEIEGHFALKETKIGLKVAISDWADSRVSSLCTARKTRPQLYHTR